LNEIFQRGWGGGVFDKLWKIPRDSGGYSLLQKTENPGRRGVLSEIPSVVGVWIFSGTTYFQRRLHAGYLNQAYDNFQTVAHNTKTVAEF